MRSGVHRNTRATALLQRTAAACSCHLQSIRESTHSISLHLQMKRGNSFESQKSAASFESAHSAGAPAKAGPGGVGSTYASRWVLHGPHFIAPISECNSNNFLPHGVSCASSGVLAGINCQ